MPPLQYDKVLVSQILTGTVLLCKYRNSPVLYLLSAGKAGNSRSMRISDYADFAKRFFALEQKLKWLYKNLVIQRPDEELTRAINDPQNPFHSNWTPEKSGYGSTAAPGTAPKSSSATPAHSQPGSGSCAGSKR